MNLSTAISSKMPKMPCFERWASWAPLGHLRQKIALASFTLAHLSCYIANKPRGPVLQNTLSEAVATSTVKRGFVTSKFWGLVYLRHAFTVKGEMGLSARTPARLRTCFEHLVHPMCFKTQTVGSLIPEGTQTMTAITQQASRAAMPTTGTPDPVQLHAQAHNALSMALHYLSQPQANVAGARRKAVQALSALRGLDLKLEG